MGFRFLSWNVEKFKGTTAARRRQVADLIDTHDPDVFGILEFLGKDAARSLILEHYDAFDFGLTDSKRALEILVGWRRGFFDQVMFTQRRKFQAGVLDLRPGALLSVRQRGARSFDNLLFLHTDSGTRDSDYRNRQAMFRKIWRLKAAIERLPVQRRNARLIVLGDLNTMGRSRSETTPTIRAADEIARLDRDARGAGMTLLSKSQDRTWSNSDNTRTSSLDHVIASDDLQLVDFFFPSDPSAVFKVEVDGWNNRTGRSRITFINNISDHCALAGEVL